MVKTFLKQESVKCNRWMQCYQIGWNFTTLAKFQKFLAIFASLFSIRQNIKPTLVIFNNFGQISSLTMAKYWIKYSHLVTLVRSRNLFFTWEKSVLRDAVKGWRNESIERLRDFGTFWRVSWIPNFVNCAFEWSSLVEGNEGCIDPSGKLLCFF